MYGFIINLTVLIQGDDEMITSIEIRDLKATERIAEALEVINQHAKMKSDFPDFDKLKNEVLTKLIKYKLARKIGLQRDPQDKKQVLTIVEVGDFCFHILPTESDIQDLYFLFLYFRNPKPTMELEEAKVVILTFLNSRPSTKQKIQPNTYLHAERKVSHEMRSDSRWFRR